MEYRINQIDNSNDEQVNVENIDINVENTSQIKCEKSEIEENETSNVINPLSTPKTPWYKLPKFKKIGIYVLISVVIASIVIGLAVPLSRKNKDSKNNKPLPPSFNDTDDKFIIYSYKISTLYFNSIKEETIKTILEEFNVDNKRRLKEQKKTKTINTEYLFAIVSEPNETLNIDYYTGYVLILNRNETLEGNNKSKYFDESNYINEDKNFNGLMQVKFKEDGTIVEQNNLKDLNDLYFNEINDTISCLIPKYLKQNNRNLEEIEGDNKPNQGKNNNETWVSKNIDGRLILNDSALIGSVYKADINITGENKNYKQCVFKKKLEIVNGDNIKSKDYSDKSEDTIIIGDDLDDDLTINGLIKSINTTSTQTVNFKEDGGEELALKYKDKLEKLQWLNSSSSNRLRVLSNEEYEENLKLQNEYGKNINNLRDLAELGDVTQSMQFPLVFKHELFKTNVLGIQFTLWVTIDWVPSAGYIIYKLSYQRGKTIYELEEVPVEIENYSKVAKSHKYIIVTIIYYLKEKILKHIDGNYNQLVKLIKDNLKPFSSNFDNVLDPLSKLYEVYFKASLEKFKNDINKEASNSYEDLHKDLNIITTLEGIENSLIKESETNLNNLFSLAVTALNSIIVNHKSNLKKLENNTENFINVSLESLNELKSYQKVSIDFYYRVKEIFHKIDVIMNSFNDNLADALDSEFLLLQSYVNDDIYMKQIDNKIDNVEIIWDIFKNNEILNKTVNSTKGADTIVSQLELVRKKYENVKDTFLNKIKSKYEELKNNNIKTSHEEIQIMKMNLNKKENILIELIKTKELYITNYEKYNEDIKKITKIENEISTIKLKAYQNNIINKLNEITTNLFLNSNTINDAKKKIEDEVNLLKNNILNGGNYQNNFNNILSKFTEFSSSNNINKIINDIKNQFSTEKLKTYVSNYYNIVINDGISKYSPLVDEIIKDSLNKYISEPVELINKIKGLIEDTDKNTQKENNKLQNLVSEKMKNILNDVISKIKNLINTEMNYVRISLNSSYLKKADVIITTGEFYTNSLNLIDDLDNKTSNYLSQFNGSLGLKTTIQSQEESINSKVSEVAENLRIKFYYLFCYENDTLNTSCPNAGINTMDDTDKYHFQVSKFRDALNHLTLLQPYINDVVNDDNLKDLSADKFLDLYKNPENFDANTIAGQIRKYLNNLIKEGINKTEQEVNKLKEVIKKSFTSGYNLTDVIFENFFKNLFTIKDLEEKLDLLYSKVITKARNGYTKDINKRLKNGFFYNISEAKLEDEFINLWDYYSKELNNTKDRLLNNLVLTNEFNKTLVEKFEDKIYNDINNYRRELILDITSKKNCKLLDYEIFLTDIVEEAIIELKNDISSTIKSGLKKSLLKDYNTEFDEYYKDLYDKIKFQYRFFFDSYCNQLGSNSKFSSSNKITVLPDEIKKGFTDGLDLCLKELENILNAETLSNSADDNEKIDSLLNDIFSKIDFKIPNTFENIEHNINSLNLVCDEELLREKGLFKDQILEYLKLGFNETILNFMKGTGKSYLDGIFLDDYDVNIIPKLDYIHNQCKEIDDYLKLIISGLFDVESFLSDSVGEVYNQLKAYIKDGITLNEINAKLLKKIEQFKYDSSEKIVNYFKEYTLNILTSKSFKNMFSEQVQLLLPSYVPYTLILNFSIIIKELLDSSYLLNLNNKYKTNIIVERDAIIDEIDKLRKNRTIQVGKLGQSFSSSAIAINIVEYDVLNATLSEIDYKFSFELTDNKKKFANNILLNKTILEYLENIPYHYYKTFNDIQKSIKDKVNIVINLSTFKKKIEDLKKNIGNENISVEAEKLKNEFINNLTLLYENLESEVKNNYTNQSTKNTDILKIDNRRRLDENDDIEIESIQKTINLIDISMINLIQNISNSGEMLDITNKINQINNIINVQLLTLDNSMESYLKYSSFYLESSDTLNKYQNDLSRIYTEVETTLKDFINNQINKINNIYNSLDNYKDPYYKDVKPKLVIKINNVVKNISSQLISKYISPKNDKDEVKFSNTKTTNLTNLGGVNTILGSTRLNYSVTVDNTVLQWGYNLKTDKDNAKVYLDTYGGGYSEATISYGNDFFNTSIAGAFGKGIIGMNMVNNFSNDRVYIDYYTKYENYSYTQTLYELTTIDSWGICEDAVDCFVGRNDDYCPYIVRIEDENKTIVKPESNDLGFYKNSSYYLFTGYYENHLCTFANYFYSAEETKYEFNSTISRTV